MCVCPRPRSSLLLQGTSVYRARESTMWGYRVSDVRFSCAFDVDASKVDLDLSEAIWCAPNNALRFSDVPRLGVPILDGSRGDGIGRNYAQKISVWGNASAVDVVSALQSTQTHVLVSFLPVGSQEASEFYADAALTAGCAFVNCIPSTIARSEVWSRKFEKRGLPLIGDDLKSQFGATLIHRSLVDVLEENGVRIQNTYQILSGGNMDFFNMEDQDRVQSKRDSKVQGLLGDSPENPTTQQEVYVGTGYIPFLRDRKVAMIRIEAECFGGTSMELDVRLAVEDSPSAAGNVLDAVRYARLAMDVGVGGFVRSVSSLLMKASPNPMSLEKAQADIQAMVDRAQGSLQQDGV